MFLEWDVSAAFKIYSGKFIWLVLTLILLKHKLRKNQIF